MTATTLVLLPGLDGTGTLFADFIEALSPFVVAAPISYPTDKSLSYAELLPFLCATVPQSQPFVLLAESFSTPLAIQYAATQPASLRALVLCAGFVTNPFNHLPPLFKLTARPWFFKLQPPDLILEHFLVGPNAPPALLHKIRSVLHIVDARVMSARVRDVLNCDAQSDLAKVKIPMMYLRPADDRLISTRKVEEIRLARPDISFNAIPGPHMILQREPRRCAALVSEFIQQLGS